VWQLTDVRKVLNLDLCSRKDFLLFWCHARSRSGSGSTAA
jgi:hypothetical protein